MNMNIDQFIRDQKSKIADERNYLLKNDKFMTREKLLIEDLVSANGENVNNGNFVLKMKEGENMKNKYKQELRNDFAVSNKLNKEMETYTARIEKGSSDTSDEEGLLYGLKYSNSASKRKEHARNIEYNAFKAMEEEKFKNRFSDKKNSLSVRKFTNSSMIKSNPISSQLPQFHDVIISNPIISKPKSPVHSNYTKTYSKVPEKEYPHSIPSAFESKIDELERKVEELRNFRIENPYIVYPREGTYKDNSSYRRPNVDELNSLQYSSTNLGKSHLKYLEDTESRLKKIEEKYDLKKSSFMSNKNVTSKKLNPFLDDNEFEKKSFEKFNNRQYNENIKQNDFKSIIPTGRENEEEIKKRKQIEYRMQLESQMNAKTKKNISTDSHENNNYFDRFGIKEVIKNENTTLKNVEKDNEYFFYASHNPLVDYESKLSPSLGQSSYPLQNERVQLSDYNYQNKNKDKNTLLEHRDYQSQKGNYREELMKQIEESKIRKEIEKKKVDDYEKRKNEEIARYEPFGRGGGGAPLRNDKGETITNLKQIIFDPDVVKRDPPTLKPILDVQSEFITQSSIEPPNSQRGFARGGHGIFGKALSDEDKVKADRYKDELKFQIEKNKKQKELEKENEKIREENERIKFEREQKQIQIELENEKKKQQEKELEKQKRLEESKLVMSKEKERIHKEKVAIDKANEERVFSPVLLHESPRINRETILDKSKLEIEASSRAQIHREDSKIMSQLYKLKNQLENEKLRVEQALIRQRDEVEIYDPRLNKNNPFKTNEIKNDFNSDIFQSIVDYKKPLTVRRDHLKSNAITTPRKHKNTEADLDEYLKQQEKLLDRMNQKGFSKLELMMPKMEPHHVGLRPGTQMSNQLESDSAFISFDQSNDFNLRNIASQESDFDYNFSKPKSPKLITNSEFGSNTSLNIDELTRKNQQRLRKLQKLQDENGSFQNSEDILNKIVSSNNIDSDLFNGLK